MQVSIISTDPFILQRGEHTLLCEGDDVFELFEDTEEMMIEFDYLVELAKQEFPGVTLM